MDHQQSIDRTVSHIVIKDHVIEGALNLECADTVVWLFTQLSDRSGARDYRRWEEFAHVRPDIARD
jgi:hypothetical protein